MNFNLSRDQKAQIIDALGGVAKSLIKPERGPVEGQFRIPATAFLAEIDGKLYVRIGAPPSKGNKGKVTGWEIPAMYAGMIGMYPGAAEFLGDTTRPQEFSIIVEKLGEVRDAGS